MITPLTDKILVRSLSDLEAADKNAAGIYLPDSAKTENHFIVVAVGEGVFDQSLEKTLPNDVVVGDKIVLGAMTWKETVKDGKTTYYIIKNHDILGIIT